jgi:outer membrane protein TolC
MGHQLPSSVVIPLRISCNVAADVRPNRAMELPMSLVYRPPSARHRRLTAVLGLGAFLGGCTVGPDFSRPETRQTDGYTADNLNLEAAAGREAKQSLAVGTKISAEWWRLFHSTRLTRVLEQAIAENLNLAAAKATLAQARDAVDQAAGALWPHAQLSAGVSRQQTNEASLGINSPHVVSNLFTVGPNVSYAATGVK